MAVVFSNNGKTTLSANVSSSATSISVSDGSVFPSLGSGEIFFCTLDDGTNNEIVKVTAISSNTLTVVRAQESTTARAFSTGDAAELRLTAGILGLFSQTGVVITDEIESYLDGGNSTPTFASLTAAQIASTGSMTLDVGGNLTIDVDGTTITLADGGLPFGQFYNNASGQFNIKSPTQNKDIVFLGNDGGTTITALTLDMSVGGQLKAAPLGVSTPTYAFSNDSNTGMTRPTGDTLQFVTNGAERLRISNTSININNSVSYFNVGGGAGGSGTSIDNAGNIQTDGTISSGAITTTGHIQQNNGYEIRSKDTGGTVRTIMRVNGSNELEYGWSGNGKVKIMGGGSYTERFSIGTDGNATFAGKVTINEGDVADQLVIYRTSPSANQVGMKFDVHGVHSRFFGVGTDGHPYWSTTANLTGAGNGVWHSGLSNFKVGTVSVLTSSRNLQNIGTISAGVTTITSSGTIGGNTPANGYLKITDGSGTLALDTNEVHTTENLFLNAEDGTIYLRGNDSGAVNLRNGSIQFMDTTRNLLNIGTINTSVAMSSSPTNIIYMAMSGNNDNGGGGAIRFDTSASNTDTTKYYASVEGIRSSSGDGSNELAFFTAANGVNSAAPTRKMTIDEDGRVLVGTTDAGLSSSNSATGINLRPNSASAIARSGGTALYLNRLTDDGDLVAFRKDGTTVGSIGTYASDLHIGTGNTGIGFNDNGRSIVPMNTSTPAYAGSLISLGTSSVKFKDLHLSGTVTATTYTGALASATTATTQSAGDNSTKVATTAYTDTAIANLADSAPSTLNTLNELAAALGDDANFSTTVTNSIATKLPLAGGTMTGNLTLNGADIVKSGSADLTIDVGGRINLSADDNGEVRLYDGSSLYGQFKDDDDRLSIQGLIQDKDMLFVVNDGGSMTTALKLDAADGGDATFYGNVDIKGGILNLGTADSSSGHINAYENMSFNIDVDNDDTNRYFSFHKNGSSASSTELMRLTEDGKLGINDNNPDRKVSIIGDSTSEGQYPLSLDATNTDYTIEFKRNGSSEWWIKQAGSAFNIHENGVGDLLRIYAGGNVSIGVNEPSHEKLYVDGNIRADGSYKVGGTVVIDSSRNLTNIGTISSGYIQSSNQIRSTHTGASPSFWGSTTDAYMQVGPNGGGASGVFGAHRLTTSSGLDYTTYIGYDVYYDDGNEKWFANRTNLGRKWKVNFGGYHQDTYKIQRYDGGGTSGSSLSAGWLEADWDDLFTLNNNGNATFTGTISSGAITSSGQLTSNGGGVNVNGGTGNAYVSIGSDTGNWIWKNYRASHHLALEDSDGTGEVLRVDTSGNILFGKTSTDAGATQGFEFRADLNDLLYLARAGNAITLNRLSSDGDIALFRKDGTTVGSIGTNSDALYISSPYGNDSGLRFVSGIIAPATTTGANRDAAIDLGYSSGRFKDLYLSGTANVGETLSMSHTGNTSTISLTQKAGTQNSVATISANREDTSSSASRLLFSTNNGTSTLQRMRINNGGDISFYEDTGTSIGFFWDASAESLGIGTTSIIGKLHANDSAGATLTLTRTSGATSGNLGKIRFGNTNVDSDLASIVAIQDGATNNSALTFGTQTAGYAVAEAMRLDSSQNATFAGTISSGSILATANNYQFRIKRTDNAGDDWKFYSWTDGLNIFPASASTVFFGRDGQSTNVSVYNGNLQIGTTTVIDSSRNLTNIGTISSGAITSTGDISAEDNIYLTDAGTVRGKLLLNASDRDNVELRAESLGSTMKFFTVGTQALLLDASQNATFAGTISSGAITANAGTGVSSFYSSHTTSHDDWQVSPISIEERGLIGAGSTSNSYSPNLNFHWNTKVSRSLTMTSDGNFTLGEWTSSGSPEMSGNLSFLNTAGYRVNNTNVIDSSRNIVNINGGMTLQQDGTYGSGYGMLSFSGTTNGHNRIFGANTTNDGLYLCAATGRNVYVRSNGHNQTDLTLGKDGSYSNYVTVGFQYQSNSNGTNRIFARNDGSDGIFIAGATGHGVIFRTNGSTANTFAMTSGGNFQVNNTTILDQSRNLSNIGTISSGAISSTGDLTLTQSSGNNILYLNSSGGGNPVIYIEDSTRKWGQFVAGGALYLKNETANIETLKLENNGNITFVGDMNIGGTGNNNVRVRHIEGKDSASSNYGGLYLNYASTANVQIGHSGNLNDLFIYGSLRTGGTARIDNSGNLNNIGTVDAAYFDSNSTEFTSTRPIKLYHEGGNAATQGGIFLEAKYSGDDILGSLSSAYSSGVPMFGSGMAYKAGASGIVSTFDNFSGERSGIKVNRGQIRFTGTSGAVQTTVGSDLTVVDTFIHDTTDGDTTITGSMSVGDLSIGNTTVINGARSLTNIASANVAGNITVDYTGNGTNDAGIFIQNDNNDWGLRIHKTGTNTHGMQIDADGPHVFRTVNSSGAEKFRIDGDGDIETVRNITSTGDINSSNVQINSNGIYLLNGDYRVGTTTVIDSSRNLTNIGTISSGAITATGLTTLTNLKSLTDLYLSRNDGTTPAFVIEQFDKLRFITDSTGDYNESHLGVNSSNVLFTNNGYAINGTTVIDSSRNLTNIASATFTNDIAINNGSPEMYFGTTGNHYNWRIAAQENVNAAFEISVGSQDTNYANDTYTTKFHINNTGTGTFAGDVVAYSDERLKSNIQTLDGKKALQMRGVSFEKDGKQSSGVIAQEIEKIAPELVHTNDDEIKTKSVAYGNLVGYLIEAIKEQQKEIEYMKSEINNLKEVNNGD